MPVDRAQSYAVFRKQLLELSEQAIEFEAKGREELQMIENYGFIVPHENITDEEIKKIEDDKKAKKAEWIKKTKKKAKTEDEENNDLEELRNRVSNNLKNEFLTHRVEKAQNEVEFVKIKWLFDNHIKMDENQFDELYRLESVLDIDISGKDLILRLDLDVPMSPYIPPQTASMLQTLDEKSQNNTKMAAKKLTP